MISLTMDLAVEMLAFLLVGMGFFFGFILMLLVVQWAMLKVAEKGVGK